MRTPWLDLRQGDALTVLGTLAAESVNCCVTSPPYWGLRDYGVEPVIWGGNPICSHKWETELWRDSRKNDDTAGAKQRSNQGSEGWRNDWRADTLCERCSAWRGSLGLERTPEAYVFHLVSVLHEVKRVLRADGTLWLNLGDSYNTQQAGNKTPSGFSQTRPSRVSGNGDQETVKHGRGLIRGLKPKDLVGIPWMVAFALRADGWYLRSEIIWSKPNPMPESVTDRPTKAHEQLFLLTKAERYYYDAEAIMEPNSSPEQLAHNLKYAKSYETYDARAATTGQPGNVNNVGIHSRPTRGSKRRTVRLGIDTHGGGQGSGHMEWNLAGRNRRSVWTVPTRPYPDAHFATFPPDLIKPCILAGCPEGGTALDPFVGSGTTCYVANQLGRRAIGIDLNPAYIDLALERCAQATIWEHAGAGTVAYQAPAAMAGTEG